MTTSLEIATEHTVYSSAALSASDGSFMLGMNAVSTLAFEATSAIFAGLTAPLLMILSRRSYSCWK